VDLSLTVYLLGIENRLPDGPDRAVFNLFVKTTAMPGMTGSIAKLLYFQQNCIRITIDTDFFDNLLVTG
jgi:hypothetical protein